jgi:hypothetical protein
VLTLKYKGNEIDIIVNVQTLERLLDAFYPNKGLAGVSKGYCELVRFFFGPARNR